MRVVFDTNVVVAGIVAEGLCREILEIHVPDHTAVLSDVLWDELVSTLQRKFRLTADDLPGAAHAHHRAAGAAAGDLNRWTRGLTDARGSRPAESAAEPVR